MRGESPAQQSEPGGSEDPAQRALEHLVSLQRPDGSWEGEMVWCTMILSQYIIVRHIVRRPIEAAEARLMVRHYEVTRNPDGSWGLHGESAGYVFTTTLAYVALRLLGLPPEHPLLAPALAWLHRQPGGVLSIPTWGKLWLAMMDLYGWEGVNPCPPELFVLPEWLPVHPNHYYCHTRYIYLGIAYLYGRRFRARLGPITEQLRRELYPGVAYADIDFAAHRHDIAQSDLYVRPSPALRRAYDALWAYERRPLRGLRQAALDRCFERILYEQRMSRYQALSPVNGLLNCLALYSRSPHHPDLPPSLQGLEAWRWQDEAEGIRYAGARSHAWDTAFALQAILASPDPGAWALALRRGYGFLRDTQMSTELPHHQQERRDPILGGWCFSDGGHRWPVSDCTAEALTALLGVQARGLVPPAERMAEERLEQAVAFILRRQNPDGGFGTYERRRGSYLLELINPSEMYGNCMTERSYIECTASSVAALAHFRHAYPWRLRPQLDRALWRGVRFLRGQQRADGSYPGFWGIYFTYAIFHVVKGLRAAGVLPTDPVLVRAARWLKDHQKPEGAWGEHHTSCLEDRYVEHPQGQVVMTAWALLALMEIDPRCTAVERGVAWLRSQQRSDGSFPQQSQNGVFFGTAMLDYRLYKAYFPAWVLARHAALRAARP
ncbi:MAG: 2,3-oxidosqualene cyclase [Myxococcales bacterium]|nr:2,3-oxidosqualene cyclase [Myxococcota bacterium]MDW8283633.1 2,3-oxidosqualene cyclase [Myxococcales bacterium]